MKKPSPLLTFLGLLLAAFPLRAASPTFGQVMWTNDLAKVLLSPERSTNRVQLGTNLVTFGGVSSAFPAFLRSGTTNQLVKADGAGFGQFVSGQIRSRTEGIYLDTEDSPTAFAYSLFFRKRGATGNTNAATEHGSEIGNVLFQGWDGTQYITGGNFKPVAEQTWSGANRGMRMVWAMTASNTLGTVNGMFWTLPTFTNFMITFNGTSDTFPALRRFGRYLQIRSADDTGFADLAASNAFFAGPILVTSQIEVTNPVAGANPSLRLWAGGGRWYTELVNGEVAGSTNRISFSISSNNLAVGQVIGYVHSVVNNNGIQNIVLTNGAGSPWLTSNNIIAPASTSFPGLKQGLVNTEAWNPTNTGFGSIGFGSNSVAGGYFSSVLGGGSNAIATNSQFSAIVGGELNTIAQAAGGHNFIGAGMSNIISSASSNGVIVGGFGNIISSSIRAGTIVGGQTNRVENLGGFVGGGFGNFAGGQASAVAGGQQNVAGNTSGSDWVFVGGGQVNQVNPDWGAILGGSNNFVQNNATYGAIGGGRGNSVNGTETYVGGGVANDIGINSTYGQILGGISNSVAANVVGAAVVGNFGTNNSAWSVLISPRGTQGSNALLVTATASTNIGPLYVRAGQATLSARVDGNLTNDITVRTNHSGNGAFTNLAVYTVAGNALTNTGDTLLFYLRGNFKAATATTNDFKCIYGTATLFDTGFITASNCTWESWIEITRTGNSAQIVGSKVHWIVNGTAQNSGALSIYSTNSVNAENNGITNIFVFQGASRTAATITNDLFKVGWQGNNVN